MKTQSAQQAKETIVFVINFTGEVEETTLYDHVVESAEKTTSPRGVMTKLFFEEHTISQYNSETEEEEEKQVWALKTWGLGGNGPARVVAAYNSSDEAADEWFTRTFNHDFMPDDQRDTMYWLTLAEAEGALAERTSE